MNLRMNFRKLCLWTWGWTCTNWYVGLMYNGQHIPWNSHCASTNYFECMLVVIAWCWRAFGSDSCSAYSQLAVWNPTRNATDNRTCLHSGHLYTVWLSKLPSGSSGSCWSGFTHPVYIQEDTWLTKYNFYFVWRRQYHHRSWWESHISYWWLLLHEKQNAPYSQNAARFVFIKEGL